MGLVRDVVQLQASRLLADNAASSMADWIADMRPWNYFATLTYDPVKVLAARGIVARRQPSENQTGSSSSLLGAAPAYVGMAKMTRDVKRFRLELSEQLQQHVNMVAGIEPHESGSLHAHVLLHMVNGVTSHDKRAAHDVWFPLHGWIRVDGVHDLGGAAAYLSKFQRVASYATKKRGEIYFGVSQ